MPAFREATKHPRHADGDRPAERALEGTASSAHRPCWMASSATCLLSATKQSTDGTLTATTEHVARTRLHVGSTPPRPDPAPRWDDITRRRPSEVSIDCGY